MEYKRGGGGDEGEEMKEKKERERRMEKGGWSVERMERSWVERRLELASCQDAGVCRGERQGAGGAQENFIL